MSQSQPPSKSINTDSTNPVVQNALATANNALATAAKFFPNRSNLFDAPPIPTLAPLTQPYAELSKNFFQNITQNLAVEVDMIKFAEDRRLQNLAIILEALIRTNRPLQCPTAAGTGHGHFIYTTPKIHEVQRFHLEQVIQNSVSRKSTSLAIGTGMFCAGVSHDSMDVNHREKLDFIMSNTRSITFTRACHFCTYRDEALPQATEETRVFRQDQIQQFLTNIL